MISPHNIIYCEFNEQKINLECKGDYHDILGFLFVLVKTYWTIEANEYIKGT